MRTAKNIARLPHAHCKKYCKILTSTPQEIVQNCHQHASRFLRDGHMLTVRKYFKIVASTLQEMLKDSTLAHCTMTSRLAHLFQNQYYFYVLSYFCKQHSKPFSKTQNNFRFFVSYLAVKRFIKIKSYCVQTNTC